MKKKAFIFDLDGVIVFTDQYHYKAWKSIADQEGIYFDETINNRLRGVSRSESLDIILEHGTKVYCTEEKERLMIEKNERYLALLNNMTRQDVSETVRKILGELKERGHKLAIGSSSKNAKFILEKVGLIHWFDAISDGTNIIHSKPHPEVFLKAAEYLGEEPSNCIAVEDACAGIDAAGAAGMFAIGIGDAAGYEHTDRSIIEFEQLLELI